eukprot:CAMPEP_0184724604 /NCGR_PEP_ID=MMETSP0314-20130426/28388_1 /TAXON_ID=38298 /ORGANISM="Rhodella maculata, Strain CCMP 736" /LENGTH=49 /DNA_ID=CAMNT_0027189623 /DNA_START=354 /DNA_END=503 /DNA_ORIENTATION=+
MYTTPGCHGRDKEISDELDKSISADVGGPFKNPTTSDRSSCLTDAPDPA